VSRGLKKAWIALGGNLGDRRALFAQAVCELGSGEDLWITRRSPVYETPPMGPPGQDRYWNAVVEVETSLEPPALLARCQEIERRLGRVREVKWGPRVMDLDILLFEGWEAASPELTLPHPGITQRAFVLRPLADILPDYRIEGKRVEDWLALVSCGGMDVVKDFVLPCP